MKLVATTAILYQNRIYEPGEALPAADAKLVAAWLESGSAEKQDADLYNHPLVEDEENTEPTLKDEEHTEPKTSDEEESLPEPAPEVQAPRRRGRNG